MKINDQYCLYWALDSWICNFIFMRLVYSELVFKVFSCCCSRRGASTFALNSIGWTSIWYFYFLTCKLFCPFIEESSTHNEAIWTFSSQNTSLTLLRLLFVTLYSCFFVVFPLLQSRICTIENENRQVQQEQKYWKLYACHLNSLLISMHNLANVSSETNWAFCRICCYYIVQAIHSLYIWFEYVNVVQSFVRLMVFWCSHVDHLTNSSVAWKLHFKENSSLNILNSKI